MAKRLGGGKRPLRLLASGLVISGSVIGAWFVIDSSKATESYLITKLDLASGSKLFSSDFSTGDLALFAIGQRYLKSNELPIGAYLTRPIAAGEVIPRSAVTTQFLDDWSNLVITPSIELSSSIGPGSKVLVWASPYLDYQSFGEPAIAALDVEVVEIREPESNFAQALKSVELRVPLASVQTLLRSISNGDAIALTASGSSLAD
jgi:hypothetical protein